MKERKKTFEYIYIRSIFSYQYGNLLIKSIIIIKSIRKKRKKHFFLSFRIDMSCEWKVIEANRTKDYVNSILVY